MTYHVPVLGPEAITYLVTDPEGIYIDGTIGGGGHSDLLLARLGQSARVIGFDQDPDAVAHVGTKYAAESRIEIIHANVTHLRDILRERGIDAVHGVLLDLGVSSHQFDEPERGFSFRSEGPLDMRMKKNTGRSAGDIVNDASEEELANILYEYGEERQSRRIAKVMVRARARSRIETTAQLAEVVKEAAGGRFLLKSLARVFQALRIAVNDELRALQATLQQATEVLVPGGTTVVISYHSLEDRIVKTYFKSETPHCVCPPSMPVCRCGRPGSLTILTSKPVTPNEDEISANPRARSARLRAARKLSLSVGR